MAGFKIKVTEEFIEEAMQGIRNALYENMTINDEVTKVTSSVVSEILSAIPRTKMTRDSKTKAPMKKGVIQCNETWGNFSVQWSARYFKSENLSAMPTNTASFTPSQHLITVTVFVIDGKIDQGGLYESMQHELHHIFERFKRQGKEYNNMDRYTVAFDNIKKASPNTISYVIYASMYITFTFEQRAYLNGAYAKLMNSDDYENGFENAIRETKLFSYLMALKQFYLTVKAIPSDNKEMEKAFISLDITKREFLRYVKAAIIRLNGSVARVIEKAKKDYKAQHKIVEYGPSDFVPVIAEEPSPEDVEREAKRLKALKRHLIWRNDGKPF